MTAEPLTAADPATPTLPRIPVSEYEKRIAALRAEMRRRGLAAVTLAGPESIYHLLGLDHLGYFAARYAELYRAKGDAEFSFHHPAALTSAPALPKF